MSELTKPKTEIQIKIQNFEFTVKYPLSGEMIEIATLKAKLSDNQYNELMYQNSTEAGFALKLINTYCFLTVMVPSLKDKDKLNVQSLMDITALESVELIHIYDNQISPWLSEWTEIINQRINELKGTPEKKNIV